MPNPEFCENGCDPTNERQNRTETMEEEIPPKVKPKEREGTAMIKTELVHIVGIKEKKYLKVQRLPGSTRIGFTDKFINEGIYLKVSDQFEVNKIQISLSLYNDLVRITDEHKERQKSTIRNILNSASSFFARGRK